MNENLVPRPEVNYMAKQMESTLSTNDFKPHWRNCSLEYLLDNVIKEGIELSEVILANTEAVTSPQTIVTTRSATYERLRHECIDIANFCMMVIDVIDHPATPAPTRGAHS